jgi:hypothetical protein
MFLFFRLEQRGRSEDFKSCSARLLDVGWTEFFWVEPNVLTRPSVAVVNGFCCVMDLELSQIIQWRLLLGHSPILFIVPRL